MLIGAVQFGIMYLAYLYTFTVLKAYQAAIFTIFTPIYVVLFDAILTGKFRRAYFIAAVLSVVGALIVKYEGVSRENLISGFIAMQAANLAFAAGQVFYVHWKRKHTTVKNTEIFASLYMGATLLTVTVCLFTVDFPATIRNLSSDNIIALVYLGIIASGIGFFLWNIGATQTNAGTLAVFNNALPPIGALISILFFGEYKALSPEGIVRLIAGSSLIVGMIFYCQRITFRNYETHPSHTRRG